MQRCYENSGLTVNPSLSTWIEVELMILPTGMVSEAAVVQSGLDQPGARETALCITAAARHWRFDRGPYGPEIHVVPYHLSPELLPLDARI